MAVTRFQRKVRKNYQRAENRKTVMKQLMRKPIIPNVDVEAIRKEFEAKKAAKNA